MIKVFHLIKSLGRGGAEVLLVENLRNADRSRFVFRYGHFMPTKQAMVQELANQDVEVVCFGGQSALSICLRTISVVRYLRHWHPNALHCHLPLAGIVGRIAGKLCGIPVIYTEHNRMERYHPLTRKLNILTWGWQKHVIAVSEEVALSIRKHTDRNVPVTVVRNGVDTLWFDRNQSENGHILGELGIPLGSPIVGTVAVFRPQKALDQWLEAARLILDEHPMTHFIIVGDGPLREELVLRCEALGLREAVHFTGLQDDVRPYLAAMNVFMVSSLFEGLPVALLEAMSMRCAIVATGVGGIPEVIRSGWNGSIVQPGNPQELYEHASRLLGDPREAARFGSMARETVERRFQIKRMTEELESIYAETLESSEGN